MNFVVVIAHSTGLVDAVWERSCSMNFVVVPVCLVGCVGAAQENEPLKLEEVTGCLVDCVGVAQVGNLSLGFGVLGCLTG